MIHPSVRSGLLAALVAVGAASGATAAEIYKTYDENGNVVYTDRPPSPDAEPIALRELSIVEAPTYSAAARSRGMQETDGDEGMSFNELRANYRDFRLVSPLPDENIWGTGQTATLSWDASQPLGEGMMVVYYLDGQAVSSPTRATTFRTQPLDRGEHSARADLIGPNNRVIASAGPVTFYVKQNSRLFNQPRPSPTGP